MKIKTITCSNAENHGARLQTFALAKFLTDEGHDVRVINYRPEYMRFSTSRWYFPGTDIKEWVKLLLRYGQRCTSIRRHAEFDSFSKSHIPLTDEIYLSHAMLAENPPEADVYIAGSDQIWNVDFPNGNDRSFFLDFGNDTVRRLSYAASFALPNLPHEKKEIIQSRLNRFDSISVRESSGVKILHDLNLDGTRVTDPVFLLCADFWRDMALSPDAPDKYLLIYDFMQSEQMKSIALEIARLRKLKIYSVGPVPVGYADKNFTVCSPEAFVGLIRDADCVLSNSFHATAFSLIFEKDFFVVDRIDGLNDRMHDLMTAYGLEHNIVSTETTPDKLLQHTVYDSVTPALSADIDRSKAWLRDNLSATLPSHCGE